MNELQRVSRETAVTRRIGKPRDPLSFAGQVRATLKTGDAVAVPINGETYAVVRNRMCSGASHVARQEGATSCTAISTDGLSVLFWLEPKASS